MGTHLIAGISLHPVGVRQPRPYGWVVARVEDARIYNAVLDEKEINNLTVNTLDVEAHGKLAMTWGRLKSSK